mgnify:FL=1
MIGVWDYQYPRHRPEVLDIALQLAADYHPDVFILGGDNLDCTSVSSHGAPAKIRVQQPINKDFSGLERDVLDPIDALGIKTKIWFRGNHEKWLDDYTSTHPELHGFLDEVEQLHLKERGWKIIPYKKYWRLGKIYYHHGDWRANRQGRSWIPRYHAAKAVSTVHRNIRYGHHHTLQAHSEVNPISSDDAHTALSIPAGCKLEQHYLEGGDTNWLNGLYIGWVRADGSFNDYVIIVHSKRAIFAGKEYTARYTAR